MRSPATRVRQFRCAIYTRKSSEEGLEQDFNSLHAQREASESYIKSQKHEGWNALPAACDDGGYSGGTTERPGLQKLLADIQSGMIDVVVVLSEAPIICLSDAPRQFSHYYQAIPEVTPPGWTNAYGSVADFGFLSPLVITRTASRQRISRDERDQLPLF